jgi:alpha-tubulin suppressor-like RCC1 family protein
MVEDPVVGRMAAVVTDTRLVVRSTPGTGTYSKILAWYLYPQQRAEVMEGPVLASGYFWYRIRVNEDEGWVAGRSRAGEPWLAQVTDRAIAAGSDSHHTCVVTGAGGAKCWGANDQGQLGDGTRTSSGSAVDVAGLSTGVTAVAAGWAHTCALTTAGIVRCWGYNRQGQLGDGTTTGRRSPIDVVGLSGPVGAITAGDKHTCALTLAGGVKCWGANDYGQLGDGTTINHSSPVDVAGLASGVSAIAAGAWHTCALTSAGGVVCWGRDGWGQLGDGTTTGSRTPVNVAGLARGATAVAAGEYHTCALVSAGGVKCWGGNGVGQLGDGTTASRDAPADVSGLTSGIGAITAGYQHTCALVSAGGVQCWGGNEVGQLGDGTTASRSTPADVAGLASGVRALAAGAWHTCALTGVGGVVCWGVNSRGELGDGTTGTRLPPVNVEFSLRQTTNLRASRPPATIARETTVTFTATVRPVAHSGVRALVRFVVHYSVSHHPPAWVVVVERDVRADATGRASISWTFSTAGSWRVAAQALANENYAASKWSANLLYGVR